jgi:DHA1 family bicyclomycin/chloramphenicol resistance-like MFS transporter
MNPIDDQTSQLSMGYGESLLLMALLISIVALSVDTMLPALPAIGADLGVKSANDVQLVISILFLGLSAGLLFYGPLSDSLGRRPVLFAGITIYLLGSALSIFSTDFSAMLYGRFLQGLGAAGPRTIVLALVRDQYEGRAMARIMSTIMSIFIMIPVFAPSIGQAILLAAGWRAIFGVLLALSLIVLAWFGLRQPETLSPRHRLPFSPKKIATALVEVGRHRIALSYTVVTGFVMGAFLGYLSSAQQIFQDLYGQGLLFPFIFGTLALSLGCALFFNSRIVMRLGMRRLVDRAMMTFSVLSSAYFAIVCLFDGRSPFWMLMVFLLAAFFCIGFLFGNLNAIAMRPLGHIAGTASAVIGALSTFLSVPIAFLIGRLYNNTTLPLVGGFALLSLTSLCIMRWAYRARKRGTGADLVY